MTQHYLLEVEERAGDDTFLTQHIVEASDAQMVKYHFHRTLKSWGYNDSRFGKHYLIGGGGGRLGAEIHNIVPLNQTEYNILNKYLSYWTKV